MQLCIRMRVGTSCALWPTRPLGCSQTEDEFAEGVSSDQAEWMEQRLRAFASAVAPDEEGEADDEAEVEDDVEAKVSETMPLPKA